MHNQSNRQLSQKLVSQSVNFYSNISLKQKIPCRIVLKTWMSWGLVWNKWQEENNMTSGEELYDASCDFCQGLIYTLKPPSPHLPRMFKTVQQGCFFLQSPRNIVKTKRHHITFDWNGVKEFVTEFSFLAELLDHLNPKVNIRSPFLPTGASASIHTSIYIFIFKFR